MEQQAVMKGDKQAAHCLHGQSGGAGQRWRNKKGSARGPNKNKRAVSSEAVQAQCRTMLYISRNASGRQAVPQMAPQIKAASSHEACC